MHDTGWNRIARIEELKEGIPISVKLDKAEIFVVLTGGSVYAMEGKCSHYGGPLREGLINEKAVTCPWHNARFDITTGKMTAPPALKDLRRFPVKVENGDVYLGPPEAASIPGAGKSTESDGRVFAIVGGGAAGNAAAEMLRHEGFPGRILLITAERRLPYDRPLLSKDFLSGEADPDWVPLHNRKFYEKLGIEILSDRRVRQLKPKERVLVFSNGQEIQFDQALLATGGIPRRISIPGGDLPNVFLLRSMDDAESIVKGVETAEKAVVLGASFIGLEVAASLRKRGLEVDLVAPEEIPMKKVFGDRIGRWFQQMHEREGVRFHLGRTVERIEQKGESLRARLSDGSDLEANVIVGGLGVDPAIEYLAGTDLVQKGAVPVDQRLQTRAPGIFAAGDIAVFPDRRSGEMQRIEHWVVAEAQGQHAARAMLGSDIPYDEIPFFWTRQYGRSIKYLGHASSFDKVAYRSSVEEKSFFAGYYQQGRLKAAASLGGGNEFVALGELLKAGIPPSVESFENVGLSFIDTIRKLNER